MVDADNIFKYCTPKYVYIRDAKLGIMKYSLMGLIFFYVVIYKIFITCDHLVAHVAQGYGTIQMRHPVEDCDPLDKGCFANWDNLATLPYCDQYLGEKKRSLAEVAEGEKSGAGKTTDKAGEKSGAGKTTDKAEVGDRITKPKTCRYLDSNRLDWNGGAPSEVFIPTHYKQIRQKVNTECYNPDVPSTANGLKKYRCHSPWLTTETQEFYVADIESFKLIFEHSFNAPTIGKFGVSTDYQGLFAACDTNHPLDSAKDCKRAKVPGTSGSMAPEDEKGLSSAEELGMPSLKAGMTGEDELTLGDFLRATPAARQHEAVRDHVLDAKLPDNLGHGGKSLRDVGGMILLDVDYENTGKWRPGIPGLPDIYKVKPITYTYRPYFVPTNRNHQYQLIQQSDHAETRVVDIWYGITIKFQFNGELVSFDWSQLLSGLTTGLVLLASATTIVCYTASFVLPLSEKYNGMMYQMSEDVTDFSRFRNSKSGYLETVINPLGLLESKAWMETPAAFASADLLLPKLEKNGVVKTGTDGEMTNADIVNILCITEMRLARLDAMDTRMIFTEIDKSNFIDCNIQKTKKLFYDDKIKGQ